MRGRCNVFACDSPDDAVPKTCYMCSGRATSKERVPPKSFFPEQPIDGVDLRRNLITVPSCSLHNGAKLQDDEFFRAVVTLTSTMQSKAARSLFMGKILRAVKESPKKYASLFSVAARSRSKLLCV